MIDNKNPGVADNDPGAVTREGLVPMDTETVEKPTAESKPVVTYVCSDCGETFEGAWSDEEAEAEAETMSGVKNAATDPGMAVVCDPCWKKLVPQS